MRLISKKKGLAEYLKNHPHRKGIVVSKAKKMIYMKPTKTAGTSILRHFLEKDIKDTFNEKNNPKEFQNWVENITDDELEDYFIFAVVRNPWDRFLSSSKHLKIPMNVLIEDFVNLTKDWNTYVHTLPIYHFTHNNDKNFADFVCRFESLQADMNLVCDYLGMQRKLLPVSNTTKHKHYSAYYQDHQIQAVQKIYEMDIKYYGYSFSEYGEKLKNKAFPRFFRKA